MRTLFTLIICCHLGGLMAFSQASPTVVYIVRHAEKVTSDPKNENPTLTKEGFKRAKSLAKYLRKIPLVAVYSSGFERNNLTARPTASKHGFGISMYNAKNLKALATRIIQDHRGHSVLVVGHSNTILETIEALGGKRPVEKIGDHEHSYLFSVTINPDDTVVVASAHYGKKSI